ncbi:hypothetical protein FGO68_gene16165 [Halteria grandinella]|uniref:GSCFA domain-containing protein n=1 Tax=Halteria grandinella TaxID=5974 RepID=A0A8J8NAB0_HALGN|nr:hypothetical protein FGO68_gene16165 [Halteria grandinella]
MASPYSRLPRNRFWRAGVADNPPSSPDIYEKKFEILPDEKIMTAGSCFAQHIATQMRSRGYSVLDEEPAPAGLSLDLAKSFGYNLYSARYANIYYVRQLLQLLRESFGEYSPSEVVWTKGGKFYDSQRPSVEPDGLDSPDEVLFHRAHHLAAVRRLIEKLDVLVFTLGLTETWLHKDGTVYPTAPGTVAGSFDPSVHYFKNMNASEVYNDLCAVRRFIMSINPKVKFLLTVSPVPLTATASGNHVLSATIYSKSVLRAAAGQMYAEFDNVDYFPSYELIASHPSRGRFFEDNLRSVTSKGVESVMSIFFKQHTLSGEDEKGVNLAAERKQAEAKKVESQKKRGASVICEEELLEAFRK